MIPLWISSEITGAHITQPTTF